ncbi:hypothetical protein [Nocardia tengchongensis]|uniref:hypothetical protein n=1 Tax=Nocardia tengchongensis TaxID=2055889 RepID=UPI0036B9A896
MSDLRQELEDAIAKLTTGRTPLDREALKSLHEHLAGLALRLKDVLDEGSRYELGTLHTRADALWKSAWHEALHPTILSTPNRSALDRTEFRGRSESRGWDGFDR